MIGVLASAIAMATPTKRRDVLGRRRWTVDARLESGGREIVAEISTRNAEQGEILARLAIGSKFGVWGRLESMSGADANRWVISAEKVMPSAKDWWPR